MLHESPGRLYQLLFPYVPVLYPVVGHDLMRHDLPLVNPCWLSPVLIFHVHYHSFQEDLPMIFSDTEVGLIGLKFPGSSFFHFLNWGLFLFFPFAVSEKFSGLPQLFRYDK